jgi:hypothetical protein
MHLITAGLLPDCTAIWGAAVAWQATAAPATLPGGAALSAYEPRSTTTRLGGSTWGC